MRRKVVRCIISLCLSCLREDNPCNDIDEFSTMRIKFCILVFLIRNNTCVFKYG